MRELLSFSDHFEVKYPIFYKIKQQVPNPTVELGDEPEVRITTAIDIALENN